MSKKNVRSRGWCYTVNNYTDDDLADCMSLYEDDESCTYHIIGFEKGSRNGVPHLQCYIYYNEAKSWDTMYKRLHPNHFSAQKAKKNVSAYVYCMKDGNYFEQGTVPRQGNRTDLEAIRLRLEEGVSLKVIKKEYFNQWCQYRRAFDAYVEEENNLKRKSPLLVIYDREDADSIIASQEYYKGKYCVLDFALPHQVLIEYNKNNHDYIITDDNPGIVKFLDATDGHNKPLFNFIKV